MSSEATENNSQLTQFSLTYEIHNTKYSAITHIVFRITYYFQLNKLVLLAAGSTPKYRNAFFVAILPFGVRCKNPSLIR